MSEAILSLATAIEPWLAIATAAALAVLVVSRLAVGPGDRRAASLDAPIPPRTEYALLAVVLAVAIALRTVGWDDGLTPPFWFSQASTIWIDRMLERGAVWASWRSAFQLTQVGWAHDSVFTLPVMAALQALLGPRFGLPVLGGAVFGSLAVVLAWALGRRVRSPAFGLLFAAFVAVSPLQLTWARIGAYYVAAVPQVLLVLLVGWIAGRRGSLVLAAVAGVLAWASLYHYFAARVAIPLALVAIVAGSQRAWRLPRGVVLACVAALAFGIVAYELHGDAVRRMIWPSYGSYPGNKGERDLVDFVRQNIQSMKLESQFAAARLFTTRRVGWAGSVTTPGMSQGGLILVPVAVLGIVGLVGVLRRLERQWIWLALAAAGAILPALSVMTARRTLVFELAWCAFAAHGLVDAVDWLGARASRRARAWAAGAVLAGIGAWAAAAVFALSVTLPSDVQQIPFGDAGFSDGSSCKRCMEAAKEWTKDIAGGAYVVVFDNDIERENRTSPAGLVMYGKIASLAGGRKDRFAKAYSLMSSWDLEPPVRGTIFDKTTTNFAAYLREQIDRADPTRIVWHFERPTAWERWLGRRLVAAGGTASSFETPLAATPGIRITTPAERRQDALAVIDELAAGLGPHDDTTCVQLEDHPAQSGAGPVFLLVPGDSGLGGPPEWLAASWREHRFASFNLTTPTAPIGGWIGENPPGVRKIDLFGQIGERTVYEIPSLKREDVASQMPPATTHGLNCAVRIDGHWWLVEAPTGRLVSSHPAASSVPKGEWLGIARGPSEELVLVSGDQTVLVFDLRHRTVAARFTARVAPAVRDSVDECAPVAAGADWIATANLRTGVGSFYTRTGLDLGTIRLDRRMRLGWTMTALGAGGHYLAAAAGSTVRVWRVTVDASCAPPARAGAAKEPR